MTTAFEHFLHGEYRTLRDNVRSGVIMSDGETVRAQSAEVRGAYLLWRALGRDAKPQAHYFERATDDLSSIGTDDEPDPPPRRRRVEKPTPAPAKAAVVDKSDDPFAMFDDPEPSPDSSFDIL